MSKDTTRESNPSAPFDDSGGNQMPQRGSGSANERLLALVKQILAKNSITRPISANDQLSDAGLSSIDMVSLMLAVEAEFDVTIPAADITPANFRSLATIEAMIERISQRRS